MKVATGLAIGNKPAPELAALAVESAMQKAGITSPACVLLFLTSEFASNPQLAIKAAAKAASCTNIIGCSAMGIFTQEDWVIDSPAVAAMVFSKPLFVHANLVKPNLEKTGLEKPSLENSIFKDAGLVHLDENDNLLLTLTAPNAVDTRWLNPLQLFDNPQRFGGVSGDAIGHGPFTIWQNAKGNSLGYCEFALNNISSAVGVSHGLKIISNPRKITACDAYDLTHLANKSALDSLKLAYFKQLDCLEDLPYHQLMAVYASKGASIERGNFSVTSLVNGNDANGSVTLAKTMQIGDYLSWALRDVDAAQVDIVKTATKLKAQLKSAPQFALLFSNLGRGPYFYNGLDQDLNLLKTLFPKLPIIGFYGNGGIAPINGQNELLQYSAVLGLFSEKT